MLDERSFRRHLEALVDQLDAESAPYFEERPRFAHGVLVVADDDNEGELLKASIIKQLDAEIFERRTVTRVAADSGIESPTESVSPDGHKDKTPLLVKRERYIKETEQGIDWNGTQPPADYPFRIPQMVGTVYERPEIISRTYRSHVEETTFPSIDRFGFSLFSEISSYRTVRSENVRMATEPRSSRQSTVTVASATRSQPDAITEAVRILQQSCDMLDETADRIARRRLFGDGDSELRFPSEQRKSQPIA